MNEAADQSGSDHDLLFGLIGVGAIAAILYAIFTAPGTEADPSGGANRASTAAYAPEAPPTKLPAAALQQCRDLIKSGWQNRVIRERPSGNRIDVDEVLWAQLPARAKQGVLSCLAADAFGVKSADLRDGSYVVAYGWRSGKRLAMLGSFGVSFE